VIWLASLLALPGYVFTLVFSSRAAPVFLAVAAVGGVLAAVLDGTFRIRLDRFIAAVHRSMPLIVVVAALTAWAAVSLAWSPGVFDGAQRLLKFALILVGGTGGIFFLAPRFPPKLLYLAIVVLVACGLYLSLEFLGIAPPILSIDDTANRSILTYVLLAWPLAAFLVHKGWRFYAITLIVSAGAMAFFSTSQTALFAWLAGLVTMALFTTLPRRTFVVLVGGGLSGLILVMPLFTNTLAAWIPRSFWDKFANAHAIERLQIWLDYDRLIAAEPITGWGLAFHRIAQYMTFEPSLQMQTTPSHPHNAALEFWVDLGAVGALGFALAIYLVVQRLAAADTQQASFAMAAFGSTMAAALVGFGALQSWWLATLAMIIFAFYAQRADRIEMVEKQDR
jgi:O-antigen ligase